MITRFQWIFLVLFVNFVYCEPKCSNCNVLTREQFANQTNYVKQWEYLVPKCCDINQRLREVKDGGGSKCVDVIEDNIEFLPTLYRSNKTGFRYLNYTHLNVVVGNPCPYGKYPLDALANSEDENYIFDNGTLLIPHDKVEPFVDLDRFCLEFYKPYNGGEDIITPFMCFEATVAEPPNGEKKVLLYAIGLLISVPFLLATFLVYILIPELRNVHGKSLACHVLCLAIAFAALASVQLAGEQFPKEWCIGIAFLIQFSFVACFFWLNVMCFDIWLNVSKFLRYGTTAEQEQQHFFWYQCYAWGLPTLLLLFSLVMDLHPAIPATYIKPKFGVDVCWFNSDQGALPYFYAPVGALILFNTVLFILTARQFASTIKETREVVDIQQTNRFETVLDMKNRWRRYKKLFRLCFILFVVMGLNWSMEVVSWLINGTFVLWTVFDIINALQGVLVFVIFVLQRPVQRLVLRRIRILLGKSNSDETPPSSDSELQYFGP